MMMMTWKGPLQTTWPYCGSEQIFAASFDWRLTIAAWPKVARAPSEIRSAFA
jgi:hypothetical protein